MGNTMLEKPQSRNNTLNMGLWDQGTLLCAVILYPTDFVDSVVS